MKKTLYALEKNKSTWSLVAVFLLFFVLRLPSLIEPDWYTDEGIYQVIGRALNQGRLLYAGIWDNKPPILYLLYAGVNGDLFLIKLISLLFGLSSLVLFFFLCQKLFNNLRISIFSSILFTLLFATPFIEADIANAENFMLLPIIASAYLVLPALKQNFSRESFSKKKLFPAGILLGIAFLIKTVAIFDFTAFFLFFLFCLYPQKITLKHLYKNPLPLKALVCYICGFVLPFFVSLAYFQINSQTLVYLQAIFLGNIDYVGYGNDLIIPQGLLLIKLSLLCISVIYIFTKRSSLNRTHMAILLWIVFSIFNVFFAQRPYPHYLLVLIPSLCLLPGVVTKSALVKKRGGFLIISLVILVIIIRTFNITFWTFSNLYYYYQNSALYATGNRDDTSYLSFFDPLTPRDYSLSYYIRSLRLSSDEDVFIWGDRPQIYFLSNTMPPGRFTVAYHILLSDNNLKQTQRMLSTAKPSYIITLSERGPFPFVVYNYSKIFSLNGATVYERD